jgi:hypothetical protein
LHARSVLEGKEQRMRLTAVCDINPERMVYDPEIKTHDQAKLRHAAGVGCPDSAWQHGEQRIGILGNFTAALLNGTRLIAPAT